MRAYRSDQDRNGNAARRRLEFQVVTDQVKRRKAAFMERLQRRLVPRGDCLCFNGTLDHKGYARMNFRYRGEHVTIHAHRVFLILKLAKPLGRGIEAGHEPCCEHRTCVRHLRPEHYKTNAATARRI